MRRVPALGADRLHAGRDAGVAARRRPTGRARGARRARRARRRRPLRSPRAASRCRPRRRRAAARARRRAAAPPPAAARAAGTIRQPAAQPRRPPPPPGPAPLAVDHAAPARRRRRARRQPLARRRRPRRPRARARAGAQPERDRRQLRALASTGCRDDWWTIYPDTRLPGAVRLRRHLRAGGRDPPAPAALAGGRGAHLGPRARRALQGARRDAAAAPLRARHPAVRGDRRPGEARARVRAAARRDFDVAVATRPTRRRCVALRATEPDGECSFGFDPPHVEIAPGEEARRRR